MSSPARRPGRIVTFYSYKGGTGRSMALANIAWILACNGKRVLAIDWDLEAPGLHRYFRPFLLDAELGSSDGLIDLIDRYATAAIAPVAAGDKPAADWYLGYADFSGHVLGLDFEHFPPGGKVDLLCAGRQSDTYAVKVSSFNWQNFYDRLGGGAFLEAVKARARADYDYVLVDSRTGVSDTAGICTAQMPDTLVVCFTYNNQSIKGAAAVARSALATHARLAEELIARSAPPSAEPSGAPATVENTPLPYVVYPVPMRVDAGESDRLALRQAFARESFADLVSHLGASEVEGYWSGVEVPHRVIYSYEEVLAPFQEDARDPKTVLAAFLRLTAHITQGEVTDYRLPISPEMRQGFLEAFAETPLTAQAKKQRAEAQRETAEQALVRNADAAIYALTPADKQSAEQVLCRLVRLGRDEEGGSHFPIRASIGDFDAAQRAVISQLARRGVLTVHSEQRSTQTLPPLTPGGPSMLTPSAEQSVGIADGRLAVLWPTLLRWLESNREFLIWRQQLRTYLADWDRSGRDNGAFLSGTLLAEAQLWLHKRAADLNSVERAYIEASAANAARYTASLTAPVVAPPTATFRKSAPASQPLAEAKPPEPDAPPRASRLGALVGLVALIAAIGAGGWWVFGRAPAGPGATPGVVTSSSAPSSSTSATATVPVPVPAPDPAAARRRQADQWVALGDQASEKFQTAEAAASYARALEADPNHLEAALKLGRARDLQGDFAGAEGAYQQAMKIDPNSPAPWLERGASFEQRGRFSDAVAAYTRAIELDNTDFRAWFNRGAARESLKQTQAAIDDFSAALRLKPDSAAALLARGKLVEPSNRPAAIADYKSVLALPAGPEQRTARDRIKALGGEAAAAPVAASRVTRVYVQYSEAEDLGRANELRKGLGEALRPATIARPEQVAMRSSGDVRFFFADDEGLARKVRDTTELHLAKLGVRADLKLSQRKPAEFPRATPGTIEIWLPSLTTTRPLPRPAFVQRSVQGAASTPVVIK